MEVGGGSLAGGAWREGGWGWYRKLVSGLMFRPLGFDTPFAPPRDTLRGDGEHVTCLRHRPALLCSFSVHHCRLKSFLANSGKAL